VVASKNLSPSFAKFASFGGQKSRLSFVKAATLMAQRPFSPPCCFELQKSGNYGILLTSQLGNEGFIDVTQTQFDIQVLRYSPYRYGSIADVVPVFAAITVRLPLNRSKNNIRWVAQATVPSTHTRPKPVGVFSPSNQLRQW
jgi:hypothetical protein